MGNDGHTDGLELLGQSKLIALVGLRSNHDKMMTPQRQPEKWHPGMMLPNE